MEFAQSQDKGVLYIGKLKLETISFLLLILMFHFRIGFKKIVLFSPPDNGHSFDAVLFYGNEWTLLTFDLMLFTFVDLICNNYLLATIVTGLAAQVQYNFLRLISWYSLLIFYSNGL